MAVDYSYFLLLWTAAVTNTIHGRLQVLAGIKYATVQNDTFAAEHKPGLIAFTVAQL